MVCESLTVRTFRRPHVGVNGVRGGLGWEPIRGWPVPCRRQIEVTKPDPAWS